MKKAKTKQPDAAQRLVGESQRVFRMSEEVTESERGMPGRHEPMKDVAHCEKGRGAVCGL